MANRIGLEGMIIDGENFDVSGEVSYNLGGTTREPEVTVTGGTYVREENIAASCSGTLLDRGDVDVQKLREKTSATVVLLLRNGKSVTFQEATWGGEGAQSATAGTIDFSFFAPIGVEG